jgi:arabinogalactan oligomer / maltooligosaccharide transport system permease protein
MSTIQVKEMLEVREARSEGLWQRATRSPGRGHDSPLKRALIHLVLIIACIIVVYPVIRVFSTALRPGDQMLSTSLAIIPEGASLDAFHRVLFESSFPNWVFNSLVVSFATAAVGVLLAASAAYAFSRHSFRGRGVGLTSLFATQMIPGIMLIVPIFIVFVFLGIVGTTQGLVLAYAVTAVPFSAWILKGYFDTVPVDLEEAARIDGCSEFQSFTKVLIPLSMPALAVVFLFNILAAWGEYFFANTIIGTNRALQTWPVGLVAFQGQYQTQWSTLSAAAIFVSVPIVILFIWTSRYLVSGLTLGGVKG